MHKQKNIYLRNGVNVTVMGFLIKVNEYSGTPLNMEPEKHSDIGWKSIKFVNNLNDTLDAVKVLQKYI